MAKKKVEPNSAIGEVIILVFVFLFGVVVGMAIK